jgi:hypothetical protein
MALNRRNPLWPYLLVLACLFALSIAAPRGWQRAGHENRSDELSQQRPPETQIAARAEVVRPTSIVESGPPLDRLPDRVATLLPETRPQFEDPAEKIAESRRFDSAAELAIKHEPEPSHEATLGSPNESGPAVSTTSEPPAPERTEPPATELPQTAQSEPPTVPAESPAPPAELPIPPSEAASSGAGPAPLANSGWPLPTALLTRLESLRRNEPCRAWVEQVRDHLEQLNQLGPQECDPAFKIFGELRRLVVDAELLVPHLPDRSAAAELRRTEYAIVRRLDIWEQICTVRRRTASSSAAEGTEGLLAQIERYEAEALPSDARHLAEIRRELMASPEPDEQELARRLNVHYRNANMRVAVTAALIDRMMPEQQPMKDSVNETVLGKPVRGQSTTSAKLSVRLIPDPRRWRFDLVAAGSVDSRTRTTAGPVTFSNNGQATYQVRKLVVVDTSGMKVDSAVAEVDNSSELNGLYTSFDSVPLIRSLVRNYALSQAEQSRGEVDFETKQKIATKAMRQVDSQAGPRLNQAHDNFVRNWVEPMRKLALDPTAVTMETTEARLALRSRLAGADQLGANTPRPEAPGDSLVSAQVHESTLNNLLDHLGLAGRTFTLPELHKWLSDKLSHAEAKVPDDLPAGVHVTFADKDPVRVRCDGNRLELVLEIAEIRDGRRRWHDFEVRAAYRPAASGLAAQFERDGTIELGGQYKGKPEVALRGIFSKVLSRERKLNLLPDTLAADPRLDGLEVTQLVVEDGWIATAIGPARTTAHRAAGTKR